MMEAIFNVFFSLFVFPGAERRRRAESFETEEPERRLRQRRFCCFPEQEEMCKMSSSISVQSARDQRNTSSRQHADTLHSARWNAGDLQNVAG